MEKTSKTILTDLQSLDITALKARLGELRRYL